MEHLTPNTRTTPDRGADHTVQPIQAIFAARFVGKKFGYRHHSLVRKAVGIGLLANLSESNRTNPKPTISRSPRAERLQEPDIFSTPPHLQSEQTQTPLAAAYRATQAEAPLDQYAVAELRHANRTNPNPSGSRISSNSGRSAFEPRRCRRTAAPEQNKPKPPRRPQKHLGKLRQRTKRSRHQTLKFAVNRPGQWPHHAAHAL